MIPDISTTSLLQIWEELIEAMNGKNRYGRDTAEIYFFNLHRFYPAADGDGKLAEEEREKSCKEATTNLYLILSLFKKMHECVKNIEVDGILFEALKNKTLLCHRVHVKILCGVE